MEYTPKSVRLPRTPAEKERWKRVIIVLEHCPLQSIQTDKGFELLSERHRAYHARHAPSDPAEWRPDVVHQCLLHLQDSALNRAGKLEVFLCTKKGVCISVDPRLRIPRHMHLFEKMMVTLLFKMKIRASTGYLSLLRVVKNPITDHFPANTKLFRVEKDGERIDDWKTFCAQCCSKEDYLVPHHQEKTTVTSTITTTPAVSSSSSSSNNNNATNRNSSASSDSSGEVEEKEGEGESDSCTRGDSGTRSSTPPSTIPVDDSAREVQKRSRAGVNEVEGEEVVDNGRTVGEKRKKRDTCVPSEAEEKEENKEDKEVEGKETTTTAETGVPAETCPAAGTLAFADLTRQREAQKEFRPFAFIVGGMSKGDVTVDYASEGTGTTSIRLGNRGMSAAAVLSQLLYAFEEAWLKEDNALC